MNRLSLARAVCVAFLVIVASWIGWIGLRQPKTSTPWTEEHIAQMKGPAQNQVVLELPVVDQKRVSTDPVFPAFLEWIQQHSIGPMTASELKQGVALAQRRRLVLSQLMVDDPRQALAEALSERFIAGLPAPIAAEVETPLHTRGDLTIFLADYKGDRKSEVIRTIEIGGQQYQACVYGRRLALQSIRNLPFHGIALGERVAIHENPVRMLTSSECAALGPDTPFVGPRDRCQLMQKAAQAAIVAQVGPDYHPLCCEACGNMLATQMNLQLDGGEATSPSDPASTAGTAALGGTGSVISSGVAFASAGWTLGPKTLLVIPADYTDTVNSNTPASLQNTLDTVITPFFAQASYGQYTVTPTLMPLVHLPHDLAYYKANAGQAINDGAAAAGAAGWNVANYDLYLVQAPGVGGGLGGIGKISQAGAVSFDDLGAAAHEIGHNLGLAHANRWSSSDGSIIGPGQNAEYGNLFSVMGVEASSIPTDPDTWMKNKLGWLPAANITTVTTSGTYPVYSMDDGVLTGGNQYALKLPNPTHGNHYWLEVRDQQPGNAWLMHGVSLLWSPWGSGGSSTTTGSNSGTQILDMAPNTGRGILDIPLLIGRTFSDRVNGYHLTPISRTGSNPTLVQVVVNIGAFPGNHAPTLVISPTAPAVGQGAPVNFTATAADADGDTLAYAWDFGDDSFGTNASSASHAWSADGQFIVRCTVTDMKGGEASASAIVTVGSPTTFTISGKALNGAGVGIQGVTVSQYLIVGAGKHLILKSAITDSDGSFTIVGLNAGSYNLDASLGGYTLTPTFVNPIAVGPNAVGKNFTGVPVTHSLSGVITDGTGAPVAGVNVSNGAVSAVTDAAGIYSLDLMDGLYVLTPTKAGYSFAPVTKTVTIAGADVNGNNFTGTAIAVNAAPTVAVPAVASPNPVTANSTILSALGADDGGEPALQYTWTSVGPAGVTYSLNGTNAAKNTTVTFTKAGIYTLTVAIQDAGGKSVNSTTSVTVNQTVTAIVVSPASANVLTGGTQNFIAAAKDQFGQAMASAPAFAWSVTGGGTISAAGLFSAGGAAGGPYTVTAATGAKSGTAHVTVAAPVNQPPVIDSAAGALPNPVVAANTTSVSVTAHDPDAGPATLTYTWSTVSGPAGVTFTPNATVTSDLSTATFTASGSYTLKVTVSDGAVAVSSQIVGLNVTLPGVAPTVATIAAATPSPVLGTTTSLNVVGADDGGEPALHYTWASVGPAPVTFSVNGTNAAKTTTATFSKTGSYTFTVTILDGDGLSVTSSVAVQVNQTLTTVTLSPGALTLAAGTTQTFNAAGKDQFGIAMAPAVIFTWSVSGGGTINAAGLFTAEPYAGGPYTVTAKSGGLMATASLSLTGGGNPVTVGVPNLQLHAPVGSVVSVTGAVILTNHSSSPVSVTLTTSQVWLSATPVGPTVIAGGGNLTLSVNADPTAMNGVFNGTLTITTSPGGLIQTLPVQLTVSSAATAGTPKRGGCAIESGGASLSWILLVTVALMVARFCGIRRLAAPMVSPPSATGFGVRSRTTDGR